MSSFRSMHLLQCAAIVLWAATAIAADEGAALPVTDLASPEIWIDGPDAVRPGDGSFSDVAVDNEGRRIHVWTVFDVFDRDDVYLRRFDAVGNPLGNPVMVNSTIENYQRYPRVAVSSDGSFLVIFQSSETPPGQGFDQYQVRSQAYDSAGNPVGSEQLLSTLPTQEQIHNYADVAALRTADGSPGGYAVVWRSGQTSGGATNGSVEGCVVSSAGVPGAQFQINSNNAGSERWSSVTELQDGGFLAVWVDLFTQDVMGRRFNSAGGGIGPDFQINTFNSTPEVTDVGIGWDGRVLVVWEDSGVEVPPLNSLSEIRGRMYGADLNALGDDFRINNVTDQIQDDPRIADLGPRGFLVVWNSDVSSGADTTQSIEARVVSGPQLFDADGDEIDDLQVQYNIWDNNSIQWLPAAHGWYGRVATDWNSFTWDGQPPPNNPDGIFMIGRDIEYCLFCDDFDWFSPSSADSAWRWTSAVGLEP